MANAKAETPDEVLVVAAILGDFDAFNELVTRYRAATVRAAQEVVGRGDAEDVAQDALLLEGHAPHLLSEYRAAFQGQLNSPSQTTDDPAMDPTVERILKGSLKSN